MFKRINRGMGILLTFSFVSVAWVFFRMRTPTESFTVFSQIGGNFYLQGFTAFIFAYYPVLLMMAFGYALHFIPGTITARLQTTLINLGWPWKALIAITMAGVVVYFKSLGSVMPIYIQF